MSGRFVVTALCFALAGCSADHQGADSADTGIESELVLNPQTGRMVQFGFVDMDGDGFTLRQGDCNDRSASVYPGAPELCDGQDNDCDGAVDGESDGDGDGWRACEDCDDSDSSIHPEATEHCDRVDEDCDGVVDDQPVDWDTYWRDYDVDGWGVDSITDIMFSCDDPGPGWAPQFGDCDDADASAYPGAPDPMGDGLDSDCDGVDG